MKLLLSIIKSVYLFFTPYVNFLERRTDKFFHSLKTTDNILKIQKKLLRLMRENLIVVNLWMERRFKGYVYLSKSKRRRMYLNIDKIVNVLNSFIGTTVVSKDLLVNELKSVGHRFEIIDEDKLLYLRQIMEFCKPGRYYRYIKTSSFGKLLVDPSIEPMEGDCNQIVTLYIYFYSLKFPIEDLKIKLLPGHVCLHFKGIDIEATNGSFMRYSDSDQILPVTEIISTNLLDLNDFREDLQVISERTVLKSSIMAYAISSLKSIVYQNLIVAFKNLSIASLNSGNFTSAIFYALKSEDKNLLNSAYKKAALSFAEKNVYKKALYYSQKSGDRDFITNIKHNYGVTLYKSAKYDLALKVFEELNDSAMIKACYGGKYNLLAKKVSLVKTITEAKKYKSVYREMYVLAQKMGDSSLAQNVNEMLKNL